MRTLFLVVLLVGCVDSRATFCGDGRVCPSGTECDDAHNLCVTSDQLTSCAALMEGDTCALSEGRSGQCVTGVCIEQSCGDGLITGHEDCDGDTTANCMSLGYYDSVPLTCSPRCAFDVTACTGKCGDEVVNGPPGVELCDGAPPAGSCLDYGFEWGRLGCTKFCAPGFAACHDMGFSPLPVTADHLYAGYEIAPDHLLLAEASKVIEVTGSTAKRTELSVSILAMWGSSATNVYAGAYGGTIKHFDGTAWTESHAADSDDIHGIWGSGPNDIYAVGYPTRILHYNGSTWTELERGTTDSWYGISGSSATNIYVVGGAGLVRRYNGSWSNVDASACWSGNPTPYFSAVYVANATSVFAVANNGVICHFNGSTWAQQPSGTTTQLRTIYGRGADDVFVGGDGGVVLHYDGVAWWPVESETPNDVYNIFGTATDVNIVGTWGTARRYTGAVLSRTLTSPTPPYDRVFAPAPGVTYALNEAGLYRRVGATWQLFRSPGDMFTRAYVAPTGEVMAVEEDSAHTVHRFNGVSTWTTSTMSFMPGGLAGRSATDILAVGIDGAISHFNGTWTPMTSNTTARLEDVSMGPTTAMALGEKQDGTPVVVRYDGANWAETTLTGDSRYLYAIYVASDTEAFAVGDDGRISHYLNGTWSEMSSGITNALIDVDGTSGTDVFAVGQGGAVLHYDGTAWTPVAMPAEAQYSSVAVRDKLVVFVGIFAEIPAIVRDGAW